MSATASSPYSIPETNVEGLAPGSFQVCAVQDVAGSSVQLDSSDASSSNTVSASDQDIDPVRTILDTARHVVSGMEEQRKL